MRLRTAAATALASLTLIGCSAEVSVGGNSVDGDDLAQQVSEKLTEQVGQAPDDVTCPDDLQAEVDAEVRCELTAGEDTYGVTVTVTTVDKESDTVNFDIEVDDEPAA